MEQYYRASGVLDTTLATRNTKYTTKYYESLWVSTEADTS